MIVLTCRNKRSTELTCFVVNRCSKQVTHLSTELLRECTTVEDTTLDMDTEEGTEVDTGEDMEEGEWEEGWVVVG
jgi:hypothetical protein